MWIQTAFLFAAFLGGFLIAFKWLSDKNKKLKQEIQVKDHEIYIRKAQEKSQTEILYDEKQRIENVDKSGSRADRLNRL